MTSMGAVTRTIICLIATDGNALTIGGGAGCHVIFMVSASGALWTLQSPERSASDIELLNAGGQEGGYPANHVVINLQPRASKNAQTACCGQAGVSRPLSTARQLR